MASGLSVARVHSCVFGILRFHYLPACYCYCRRALCLAATCSIMFHDLSHIAPADLQLLVPHSFAYKFTANHQIRIQTY